MNGIILRLDLASGRVTAGKVRWRREVCMFHLMTDRDLEQDFDRRHRSAYVEPVWFDVADPDKVGQYYNWTLGETVHAARSGMRGLYANQHHAHEFAQRIDGAHVELIERAGQLPDIERPDQVARIVRDFLDD
jgi:hypothetical protein